MHKIFVYGTLKRGKSNHYLLETSKLIAIDSIHAKMYTANFRFPHIILDNNELVDGEIYEIDDHQLTLINRLEGYFGEEHKKDNLYNCVQVKTVKNVDVLVYVAGERLSQVKSHWIESGNW